MLSDPEALGALLASNAAPVATEKKEEVKETAKIWCEKRAAIFIKLLLIYYRTLVNQLLSIT